MAKTEPAKNIIFFGNSYTFGAGSKIVKDKMNGVPGLTQRIAKAAGYPAPNVQKSTQGGKTLEWHTANKIGTIDNPDQLGSKFKDCKWDYVVLQDYSTRATSFRTKNKNSGYPTKTLYFAHTLLEEVRKNNPDAKAVMYQTWARHPKKEGFYPTPYEDPIAFQADLRFYYGMTTDYLNHRLGEGTAKMAPCGSAWEKLNFKRELYSNDLHHGATPGYLLNAMVIYRTIYGGKVSNIDLSELFKTLKISEKDGKELAAVADSM